MLYLSDTRSLIISFLDQFKISFGTYHPDKPNEKNGFIFNWLRKTFPFILFFVSSPLFSSQLCHIMGYLLVNTWKIIMVSIKMVH